VGGNVNVTRTPAGAQIAVASRIAASIASGGAPASLTTWRRI
jgi:hypothetical protein